MSEYRELYISSPYAPSPCTAVRARARVSAHRPHPSDGRRRSTHSAFGRAQPVEWSRLERQSVAPHGCGGPA